MEPGESSGLPDPHTAFGMVPLLPSTDPRAHHDGGVCLDPPGGTTSPIYPL